MSSLEDNEVSFYGNQTFFIGMLEAYKKHKSITLSPDIIWLLIVQGFSYHIAENAEELRNKIVPHEGKKELVVKRCNLTPQTATKEDWIGIVDEFVQQISSNTFENITETLEPKFSTTNQVSHTAGMISIMATMKHYFDYRLQMAVC